MPSTKKLLTAAAGSAGGEGLYPEDVFSTFLYTPTGNAGLAINNGLDLSGEGGLVWSKCRGVGRSHNFIDTNRGGTKVIKSNSTSGETTNANAITAFNSNGYTLGADTSGDLNYASNTPMASWSFRKAKGFFDIVTYTGNDTARTIAHNLGSVPKMIIVKSTSDSYNWYVYHASLTNQQNLTLDTSNPAGNSGAEYWNSTTATSSVFSLGTYFGVNGNNKTYVAYLFGDDAIFGEGGDEQICKISSFSTTGNSTITLGFEPQWLMVKQTNGSAGWYIWDTMRGWTVGDIGSNNDPSLFANTSGAEVGYNDTIGNPTATGFLTNNFGSGDYIYMAIRRPMKVPEAGTEVYGGVSFAGNNAANRFHNLGVQVDLALSYSTGGFVGFTNRLLSGQSMYMPSTQSDANSYWALAGWYALDFMNGYMSETNYAYSNSDSYSFYTLGFKAATGFLSVLAWSGQSNASYAVPHSLGVKPEIIIYKRRSSQVAPYIAETLTNKSGDFEAGDALTDTRFNIDFASTSPTSTQITVSNSVANTGDNLLAFLFASVSGVSKCGTFTGTGSSLDIDCGFSNGARFILIKRVDNSGDAYLFDYKQGITSGNSSYIVMNTGTAPVTNTDFVDPLSSGFNLTANGTSTVNISGATYLFLAIA